MLKLCTDDWRPALEVHALHEGDEIAPWETGADDRGRLLAVRPPRDRLPRLLARRTPDHAQRARGRRGGATASRSCSSPPATTTGSCRPATAGRPTWPARSACPPTRRRPGGAAAASGTVPHGLIAAFGGDTVAAAQAFADRFADEMNVTVLVDFENDSVRTALEVADALGDRLWGVRLDTSERIVDRALWTRHGRLQADRREHGARPSWCARRSTPPATSGCRSWSPAASTPRRSAPSSALGAPVDAYGVGSSLLRGENDFTADVVRRRRGRPAPRPAGASGPIPRLERVDCRTHGEAADGRLGY